MLYLLFSHDKQAAWQVRYEQTYMDLLTKYGVPFAVIDSDFALPDRLAALTKDDFLWVMNYKDLDLLQEWAKTRATVLFRISGTSVHPYCYQVDFEREAAHLTSVIDVNLSLHPRMTKLMQPYFPQARFADVGYPMVVPELTGKLPDRVPDTIVVGGRLSPDKQFMLSAFLLQPYVDAGYQVTFCFPNNRDGDSEWIARQGGWERYERRGFQFEQMDNSQWLRTLASSEFYFSASLGDTACYSCVEAVKMGCYPLTPKFGDGLPAFDIYLSDGYEPFSASDLRRLITTKPPITVDRVWIDPDLFMLRLIEKVLKQ